MKISFSNIVTKHFQIILHPLFIYLFSIVFIHFFLQILIYSVVPYREIAIYTTLQFSSIGLAQIQKIVYLGVKQHVRKKNVFQSFLRGVSVLDNLHYTSCNYC